MCGAVCRCRLHALRTFGRVKSFRVIQKKLHDDWELKQRHCAFETNTTCIGLSSRLNMQRSLALIIKRPCCHTPKSFAFNRRRWNRKDTFLAIGLANGSISYFKLKFSSVSCTIRSIEDLHVKNTLRYEYDKGQIA